MSRNPVREIISLDGLWQIIFDSENKGKRERWFEKEIFDLQEKINKGSQLLGRI